MNKKLILSVALLASLAAQASQTVMTFTMSDFGASPTTNRTVTVQPLSPFVGNVVEYSSGTNGAFSITNPAAGPYSCAIKAKGQAGAIPFILYVDYTNMGPVSAYPAYVSVGGTQTYPSAGNYAWSIAAANARFATNGSAGMVLNGLSASNQTFTIGTSGTGPNVSSSGTNHQFNFPVVDATHTGVLSSNDFASFANQTATNLGTGYMLFVGKSGTNLQFLSLSPSNGVTFATNANTLFIVGGAGIQTLNGLSGTNQTLTTGILNEGIYSDFGIYDSGTNHLFNLPFSSATINGKLSSNNWTTFNNKVADGASLASNYGLFVGKTGIGNSTVLNFLGLTNGSGISISTNSSNMVISATAAGLPLNSFQFETNGNVVSIAASVPLTNPVVNKITAGTVIVSSNATPTMELRSATGPDGSGQINTYLGSTLWWSERYKSNYTWELWGWNENDSVLEKDLYFGPRGSYNTFSINGALDVSVNANIQGDLLVGGTLNVTNGNATFSNNVTVVATNTAAYFVGDGSLLTGVSGSGIDKIDGFGTNTVLSAVNATNISSTPYTDATGAFTNSVIDWRDFDWIADEYSPPSPLILLTNPATRLSLKLHDFRGPESGTALQITNCDYADIEANIIDKVEIALEWMQGETHLKAHRLGDENAVYTVWGHGKDADNLYVQADVIEGRSPTIFIQTTNENYRTWLDASEVTGTTGDAMSVSGRFYSIIKKLKATSGTCMVYANSAVGTHWNFTQKMSSDTGYINVDRNVGLVSFVQDWEALSNNVLGIQISGGRTFLKGQAPLYSTNNFGLLFSGGAATLQDFTLDSTGGITNAIRVTAAGLTLQNMVVKTTNGVESIASDTARTVTINGTLTVNQLPSSDITFQHGILIHANNYLPFSTVQTNWSTGTLYTNTFGHDIILMGADAALTAAAAAGKSALSLRAANVGTNVVSFVSSVATITGTYTNAISSITIPINGTFGYFDTSAGGGNSAAVVGGQALILP